MADLDLIDALESATNKEDRWSGGQIEQAVSTARKACGAAQGGRRCGEDAEAQRLLKRGALHDAGASSANDIIRASIEGVTNVCIRSIDCSSHSARSGSKL